MVVTKTIHVIKVEGIDRRGDNGDDVGYRRVPMENKENVFPTILSQRRLPKTPIFITTTLVAFISCSMETYQQEERSKSSIPFSRMSRAKWVWVILKL